MLIFYLNARRPSIRTVTNLHVETERTSYMAYFWDLKSEITYRTEKLLNILPLSRKLVVTITICLVDTSNFRNKGVVWIRITQKGTDAQQYWKVKVLPVNAIARTFGNCKSRWPLWTKNIQTNAAIAVDVRMVNACCEGDFWWLEGIVSWEMDCEEEYTTLIRRFWRSHNGSLPVEKIIANRSSTALGWWITSKILQFLNSTD